MELPATGWRLPDDACALLARLVAEHRPELIVECGSGRSTVVLAEAARLANYNSRCVALEHDLNFAHETRALIRQRGLEAWTDVRWAPLEDGWYEQDAWDDLNGIGMLVVDGPPGSSARYARRPALPLLRDRMLPGCVIVLDDVNRDDEREIVRDWGIPMTLVQHEKATLGYGLLDG